MAITLILLIVLFAVILWAAFTHKISTRTTVLLLLLAMAVSQLDAIFQFLAEQRNHAIFRKNIQDRIDKINSNERPVSSPSGIPKTIIQIWVQKDCGPSVLPADQLQYIKAMKDMHPQFNHLFFESSDVLEFLQKNYPEYYITYQRLPIFIQKLDFFRYLAIYHYGGFYFDTDVEPKIALDDAVRNHSSVFPVDEYMNAESCLHPRMSDICAKGQNFLLGQYAFGAVAKHPFVKRLVDKIHQNVDMYVEAAKHMKTQSEIHHYVFKTTGPDFVSECYTELDLSAKSDIYILSNGERQVFGDYAVHQYAGLWK